MSGDNRGAITHRRDPACTETIETIEVPEHLPIRFGGEVAVVSHRAEALTIDSWDDPETEGTMAVTIAMKMQGRPVALHIGQSAHALREFGTSCFRVADKLDGGRRQ